MATQGYKLRINGSNCTNQIIDVGNTLNYTLPNLDLGETYTIEVAAYDEWGNQSNWSIIENKTIPDPLDLNSVAGMEWWFEADKETHLNGSLVDNVTNQIGTPIIPIATGSSRPVYLSAVPNLNNKPAISFDGIDDTLAWYDGANMTQYTLGFVYSDFVTPSSGGVYSIISAHSNGDAISEPIDNGYVYGIGGFGSTGYLPLTTDKGMMIIQVNAPADNIKVWINGVLVHDGPVALTIGSAIFARAIQLGSYLGSTYSEVKIAMGFKSNALLSPSIIANIFADNNEKYNLY